jgi:hypothetical protein
MTEQLQRAFSEAAKLPEPKQDLLATWLLEEIADEAEFDRQIERTASQLSGLAKEAIAEFRAGRTEELIPEQL